MAEFLSGEITMLRTKNRLSLLLSKSTRRNPLQRLSESLSHPARVLDGCCERRNQVPHQNL